MSNSKLDEIINKQFESHLVKTDIQGRHFWEPRKEEVEAAKIDIKLLMLNIYKEALNAKSVAEMSDKYRKLVEQL